MPVTRIGVKGFLAIFNHWAKLEQEVMHHLVAFLAIIQAAIGHPFSDSQTYVNCCAIKSMFMTPGQASCVSFNDTKSEPPLSTLSLPGLRVLCRPPGSTETVPRAPSLIHIAT